MRTSRRMMAGISIAELLEIIAVIGWSTLTNNLANTEIDEFWS